MAYQGTADLAAMTKDLSKTILDGDWRKAVYQIKQLNGLQALYLINQMIQYNALAPRDIDRLAKIALDYMNDGETGKGYISDSQYDDEDE